MNGAITVTTIVNMEQSKENPDLAKVGSVEFKLDCREQINSAAYIQEDGSLSELGVKLISEILGRALAANLHGHADQVPIGDHILLVDKVITKSLEEYANGAVVPLPPGVKP